MKKSNWFTVFVQDKPRYAAYPAVWIKIAEINSEGLMQLLYPKFIEVYHNQSVKVLPGKVSSYTGEVT
jgi:hypothetical protein